MKNYWNLVKENKKALIAGLVAGLILSEVTRWLYNFDVDGDGTIAIADFLEFLGVVGQVGTPTNAAFQSFANYIYALASDEFKSRVDVNTLNNLFNGITNAPGVNITQDPSTGLFTYSYVETDTPGGT